MAHSPQKSQRLKRRTLFTENPLPRVLIVVHIAYPGSPVTNQSDDLGR